MLAKVLTGCSRPFNGIVAYVTERVEQSYIREMIADPTMANLSAKAKGKGENDRCNKFKLEAAQENTRSTE